MSKANETRLFGKPNSDPLTLEQRKENIQHEAYHQMFNQVTDSVTPFFQSMVVPIEVVQDQTIAFASIAYKPLAESHTMGLIRQADQSMSQGDLELADHYLRRGLRFAIQTLDLDHPETQLVGSTLKILENHIDIPPLRY